MHSRGKLLHFYLASPKTFPVSEKAGVNWFSPPYIWATQFLYFYTKINFTGSSHLAIIAAAAAKSLQSCPTLCNPIDGSPPSSPVSGILQARTLEWVAISFSSAGNWKVKVKSISPIRPSATPWTAAYQVPPSMGFSRQEYWSGVPLSSPMRAAR